MNAPVSNQAAVAFGCERGWVSFPVQPAAQVEAAPSSLWLALPEAQRRKYVQRRREGRLRAALLKEARLPLHDEQVRAVVQAVSAESGWPVNVLLSRSRLSGLVAARDEILWRVRWMGRPVKEVAAVFGMERSSVTYALQRAEGRKP